VPHDLTAVHTWVHGYSVRGSWGSSDSDIRPPEQPQRNFEDVHRISVPPKEVGSVFQIVRSLIKGLQALQKASQDHNKTEMVYVPIHHLEDMSK
jgi:hypothetical protein